MNPDLTVRGRPVGPGRPVFFLIEEGQANNGDHDLALRMVDLAAQTGADGIEFQLAIAEDFYVPGHPLRKIYEARQFSPEQIGALSRRAHEKGLAISGMVLSERLIPALRDAGYDLLSINAADLVNPFMLDAVAASGLPFCVGTAMATVEEIDWALSRLKQKARAGFVLLHGQHIMATAENQGVPVQEASLAAIGYLAQRYDVPVGFADHTSSSEVPARAAAHGAVVLTKHLAPQAGWRGADWQVCLTPDEMAQCIQRVRLAERARGGLEKTLAYGELADRKAMRRSLVAARDLPAGHVLAAGDLAAKRPGTGVSPDRLESVYGRRLKAPLRKDQQVAPE